MPLLVEYFTHIWCTAQYQSCRCWRIGVGLTGEVCAQRGIRARRLWPRSGSLSATWGPARRRCALLHCQVLLFFFHHDDTLLMFGDRQFISQWLGCALNIFDTLIPLTLPCYLGSHHHCKYQSYSQLSLLPVVNVAISLKVDGGRAVSRSSQSSEGRGGGRGATLSPLQRLAQVSAHWRWPVRVVWPHMYSHV